VASARKRAKKSRSKSRSGSRSVKTTEKKKKKKKKKKKRKGKKKSEKCPGSYRENEAVAENEDSSGGSLEEEEENKVIEQIRRKRARIVANLPTGGQSDGLSTKENKREAAGDPKESVDPIGTPIVYFEQTTATTMVGEEEAEDAVGVKVGVQYKVLVLAASIVADGRWQQLFQLAARILPVEEEKDDVGGGEAEYFATCSPEVVSAAALSELLAPGSKVSYVS
jgi:hypothetical protein